MLIFNEEKQVIQKNYVQKIKSKTANLKDLIQSGDNEKLKDHLNDIVMASKRIEWLEDAFQRDLDACEAKAERK